MIKYEKEVVLLRRAIQAQQKADEVARKPTEWKQRVRRQGAWDEVNDPLSLAGAPALPMPVSISDGESLVGLFAHLGEGGTHDVVDAAKRLEPYYGVQVAEFERGMLYEDGRMDLCKMSVLRRPRCD